MSETPPEAYVLVYVVAAALVYVGVGMGLWYLLA